MGYGRPSGSALRDAEALAFTAIPPPIRAHGLVVRTGVSVDALTLQPGMPRPGALIGAEQVLATPTETLLASELAATLGALVLSAPIF